MCFCFPNNVMNPILTSNTSLTIRAKGLKFEGSVFTWKYLSPFLSLSFFILGTRQRKGWHEVRGPRPFVACTAGRIFYRAQLLRRAAKLKSTHHHWNIRPATLVSGLHLCRPQLEVKERLKLVRVFFRSLKPSPLFNIRGQCKIYWHWNIRTCVYYRANWIDYCARFNQLKNSYHAGLAPMFCK